MQELHLQPMLLLRIGYTVLCFFINTLTKSQCGSYPSRPGGLDSLMGLQEKSKGSQDK